LEIPNSTECSYDLRHHLESKLTPLAVLVAEGGQSMYFEQFYLGCLAHAALKVQGEFLSPSEEETPAHFSSRVWVLLFVNTYWMVRVALVE
jgi:hypothetical protein